MVPEVQEDKLIFVGLNTKSREYSYVPSDIFAKLMAKGIIRWDGLWIQDARLWPLFFHHYAISIHNEKTNETGD